MVSHVTSSPINSNGAPVKGILKDKCKIDPATAANLIQKLRESDEKEASALRAHDFYPIQEKILDWAMYTFVVAIVAMAAHVLYLGTKS